MGPGTQWWPWIHVEDVTRIIVQILEQEWHGPINAVAPESTTQITIANGLSAALNRKTVFQIPEFMLKLSGDLSSEMIIIAPVTTFIYFISGCCCCSDVR